MVRTSMTRLAEHLDDHQFQISALMKRVKELETTETTQATDLSDDNYTGRANVRWLSDRIKKLEDENTALSSALHTDREWYGKRIRALEESDKGLFDTLHKMNIEAVKRLRELERIAAEDMRVSVFKKHQPQSDSVDRSEQEKITEVIHDITQALVRIEKIIGTHGG